MANACEIISARLDARGFDDAEARSLLNVMRKESLTGYDMCKNALLQVRLASGDYISQPCTCTAADIYHNLGLTERAQVTTDANGAAACRSVSLDRQVIRSVLFNATQNAFRHGESEGAVYVSTALLPVGAEDVSPVAPPPSPPPPPPPRGVRAPAILRIRVVNRPGPKHAELLRLVGVDGDLMAAELPQQALDTAGVGTATSTYWGLVEMRMGAKAVGATVRLVIRQKQVRMQREGTLPSRPLAPPRAPSRRAPSRPLAPPRAPSRDSTQPRRGVARSSQVIFELRCRVVIEPERGLHEVEAMAERLPARTGAASCSRSGASPTASASASDSFSSAEVDGAAGGWSARQSMATALPPLGPEPVGSWGFRPLPPSLIFVCIDDDLIARIVAGTFLERVGADLEHSRVLGQDYAEARESVARIGQLAAQFGDSRVLVQLDQFMDYADQGTVLGTDLCLQLRELGFTGVIAILSANNDDDAARQYRGAGADFSCDKANVSTLHSAFSRVHHARFGHVSTPGGAEGSTLTRRVGRTPAEQGDSGD